MALKNVSATRAIDTVDQSRSPAPIRWGRATPWSTRSTIATILLTLYHQWLGERFSNPYISGDAAGMLRFAGNIARNIPPGPLWAGYTKAPGESLLYAALLRVSHTSILTIRIGQQSFPNPLTLVVFSSTTYVHFFAALATLVCILTGLVAWRYTTSRACGFTALVLAGLYAPFVIIGERALTEIPFALFLLLTTLALHAAVERPSVGRGALTAACFVGAVATRVEYATPMYALAFLLLLGSLGLLVRRMVAHRADASNASLPSVPLTRMLSALLLTLCASIAIGAALLRLVPERERLGGIPASLFVTQSPYAYVLSDGWARDNTYLPFVPDHPTTMERNDMALSLFRTPQCPVTANSYATIACLAVQSPGFTLRWAATNEYRLWWYPHNDFRVTVGGVTATMTAYHRFIVLAGVAGCFVLIARQRIAAVFLLPVGLIAAIFSTEHIELRYAVPAIPFLIVGASVCVVAALDALRAYSPFRALLAVRSDLCRKTSILAPVLLCTGALALLLGGDYLFMARGATRIAVLLARLVPLSILAGTGCFLIYRAYRSRWVARSAGVALVMALLGVAAIPAASATPDDWSVTLHTDRQQLLQKILVPAAPDATEKMAVLLDLQAPEGDFSDIMITLNGHAMALADPEQRPVFLTQRQLPSYYRWSFDLSHGARDETRLAQWLAVPVPTVWVRGGENDIAVALRPASPQPHPVRVFGQFSAARTSQLTMPSLLETSFWKDNFGGEPRLDVPATLQSTARFSLYSADGGATYAYDLSPARGIQHGTYRIFLGAIHPAPFIGNTELATQATVGGTLSGRSGDGLIDTFWFSATAPQDEWITLVDASGPLITFAPGQADAHIWHGDRADLAYVPTYRHGADSALLDPQADPRVAAAPTEFAAQYWAAITHQTTSPLNTRDVFSGTYVVRLHQPASLRDLRFFVAPQGIPDSAPGGSWATLIPPHQWEGLPQVALVDVSLGATAVENRGYAPAESNMGMGAPPSYWMMHGGDLREGGDVPRAAMLLGASPPNVRFVPSLPTMGVRGDQTPRGTLESYWAYGAASPRTLVSLTLA